MGTSLNIANLKVRLKMRTFFPYFFFFFITKTSAIIILMLVLRLSSNIDFHFGKKGVCRCT